MRHRPSLSDDRLTGSEDDETTEARVFDAASLQGRGANPVGAGSPNRIEGVALHPGSSCEWKTSNGTITAGQGTSQNACTAGPIGPPAEFRAKEANSSGCGVCGCGSITVAPRGSTVLLLCLPAANSTRGLLHPSRSGDTDAAAVPCALRQPVGSRVCFREPRRSGAGACGARYEPPGRRDQAAHQHRQHPRGADAARQRYPPPLEEQDGRSQNRQRLRGPRPMSSLA